MAKRTKQKRSSTKLRSTKAVAPKARAKSGSVAAKSPRKAKAAKKKKVKKKVIGNCFILMPFKEPFDTYYTTIIRPAVVAANLNPLRGDSLFRPSPIMGDIWAMIQDATVIVAELTEKNANVFYELGLSHAIGKPVVLISETMEDVPFDLQPLRVIIYDKDDPAWGTKLKANIVASLGETVSDPTNAVPPMFRKKVKSQAPEEADTQTRLNNLERQMATLRSDDLIGFGTSRSKSATSRALAVFYDGLRRVTSREGAVDVTRKALLRGIPQSVVRRGLEREISGAEAAKVFEIALGNPDLFAD